MSRRPVKEAGEPSSGVERVSFVSLGCPKNLVDSEKMLGLLAQDGILPVSYSGDGFEGADAVVVNTCGFLEASKDESLGVIHEAIREKERGNIEQLLVTPIKPYQLILGKIIPYVVIGIIVASTILIAMHFLFQVPVRGSILTLFMLTLVYLVVCLGIGLWASTISDNQQQASQIVMFFAMPSILLSGFMFPFRGMPEWAQFIGNILPLTHFLIIVRGILLKGNGFFDVWRELIPILGFMSLVMFIGFKRYRQTLD